MARSTGSITFLDHTGENSIMQLNLVQILADGTNFDTNATALASLRSLVAGVTLGTIAKDTITFQRSLSSALPADQNAQREAKWLVTYTDVTEFLDAPTNSIPNPGFGRFFKLEIPTADLSLLSGNTDVLWTPADAGDGSAASLLVAAMEGSVKSPYTGDIAIQEIRHVGRNI